MEEKQNDRRRKHFEESNYIESILKKIENLEYYQPVERKQGNDNGKDYSNEYFKVVQNEEENRLQLFFNGKPSEQVRTVLKSNGYVWSGRNKCWQRQLTDNARRSITIILRRAFGIIKYWLIN